MKVLAGISPVVFHSTNLSALRNILKNNSLYFTPVIKAVEKEFNKEFKYFFSTARNKTSHYLLNSVCIITLDGKRLMQNLKGKAIDYWGEYYRKHRKGDYEQEDRIFSNKPRLENANRYIKKIDILATELPKDLFISIMRNAKKLGIPVYFYENVQAFRLGAISKSIPTKQIMEAVKNSKDGKVSAINFNLPRADRRVYNPNRGTPAGHNAARQVRDLMFYADLIHHYEKYATRKNYKIPSRIENNTSYVSVEDLRDTLWTIISNRSEFSERLLDKFEGTRRQRGLKDWDAFYEYVDALNQFVMSKSNFYHFMTRIKDPDFVKGYFRGEGPEKIKEEIERRKNDVQKAADKMKSKYRLKVEV